MKLYVFSSNSLENVWIGYEHQKWAVSLAEPHVMRGRRTRASNVRKGDKGLLYISPYQMFTMPFEFETVPTPFRLVTDVWPERWAMPFDIRTYGSPKRYWHVYHATQRLPFARSAGTRSAVSLFKLNGTSVFSPVSIGDDDWSILLEQLAEPMANAS